MGRVSPTQSLTHDILAPPSISLCVKSAPVFKTQMLRLGYGLAPRSRRVVTRRCAELSASLSTNISKKDKLRVEEWRMWLAGCYGTRTTYH